MKGRSQVVRWMDDKKPQIDISSVDEIDYSLEKPKAGRTAKLPFREIVKMAERKFKTSRKKTGIYDRNAFDGISAVIRRCGGFYKSYVDR